MWISSPSRRTHADGPVQGGSALRVGAARPVLVARVPALVIVASHVIRTLVIIVTLALFD